MSYKYSSIKGYLTRYGLSNVVILTFGSFLIIDLFGFMTYGYMELSNLLKHRLLSIFDILYLIATLVMNIWAVSILINPIKRQKQFVLYIGFLGLYMSVLMMAAFYDQVYCKNHLQSAAYIVYALVGYAVMAAICFTILDRALRTGYYSYRNSYKSNMRYGLFTAMTCLGMSLYRIVKNVGTNLEFIMICAALLALSYIFLLISHNILKFCLIKRFESCITPQGEAKQEQSITGKENKRRLRRNPVLSARREKEKVKKEEVKEAYMLVFRSTATYVAFFFSLFISAFPTLKLIQILENVKRDMFGDVLFDLDNGFSNGIIVFSGMAAFTAFLMKGFIYIIHKKKVISPIISALLIGQLVLLSFYLIYDYSYIRSDGIHVRNNLFEKEVSYLWKDIDSVNVSCRQVTIDGTLTYNLHYFIMTKSGVDFVLLQSNEFWKKILQLDDYFSRNGIPARRITIGSGLYNALAERYKSDKVENLDEILKKIFVYKN